MHGGERILVVDDERLIRMTLRKLLEDEKYEVIEADNGKTARELIEQDGIDLVVLDYKLPDTTGIEILKQVRESHPETGVILMTAHSSVDNAVTAIRLGAYDYLIKPVKHGELLATITKALAATRLRREVKHLRAEQRRSYGIANIVGQSRSMRDIFKLIYKVADTSNATVLIQGESGTGKDLVAKAIHYGSDRADKPFMNITCSALPETLLESELFGHERGAFTDARHQKSGLLELADGGTVFLDEIGEMGPALQAKMLRFLEEKTFRRVGGSRDIHVDVRIISATNVDIENAVRDGSFRDDLFYRLNVIPIRIPALKDRRDDIPQLVNYFVVVFNKELRKNTQQVTDAALRCLQNYDWPGNVRELKNCIERTMILGDKTVLDSTDLPEEILQYEDDGGGGNGRSSGFDPVDLPPDGVSLRSVEHQLVRQALERSSGNQSQAARLLRISRDALRYKMKKFELT